MAQPEQSHPGQTGRTDIDARARGVPEASTGPDHFGPEPDENQPGHHPAEEQDKPPLDDFAAKFGIVPDGGADARSGEGSDEAVAGSTDDGSTDDGATDDQPADRSPEPEDPEAEAAEQDEAAVAEQQDDADPSIPPVPAEVEDVTVDAADVPDPGDGPDDGGAVGDEPAPEGEELEVAGETGEEVRRRPSVTDPVKVAWVLTVRWGVLPVLGGVRAVTDVVEQAARRSIR